MIRHSQTSRRSFLSSLAILSAGAAFGSAADFYPVDRSIPDLQKQWNNFWKEHGGKPFHELIQLCDHAIIKPCNGHFYKPGKMIYFSHANILAQPTWVYWGKEKNKPSDVIITFLKNDPGNEKILRINRFELEAMSVLFSDKNEKTSIPILNETLPFRASIENSGWKLKIKTRINKWQNAQISTTFSKDKIAIEKKLFYHIKLT
jgi:hypothetical protein